MANRSISQLTREELYELIWSTPGKTLASEFDISDVAIAKRCKKLNVPRPPRGYWAKRAAGKKASRKPLPPTLEVPTGRGLSEFKKRKLSLPTSNQQLRPLAAELLRALNKEKPDQQRRVRTRERTLPEVIVTKALAERASHSFHVLLSEIEPLGILFRKSQSSYGEGFFRKGNDRLYVTIEEELVEKPADLDRRTSRRMSWHWQTDHRTPAGRLTFSLKVDRYGFRPLKQWTEDGKIKLEDVLNQIVIEIRRHFAEAQERRAREAIEREKQRIESERYWKEYQAKEALRQEEERKRKHAEAIEAAIRQRRSDLLNAAEWWRLHQNAHDFITECERRWRTQQNGDLKPEQCDWLRWARETVNVLSPFDAGYPAPESDGMFIAEDVPFGGPYPVTRSFPEPPTMTSVCREK